MAILPNILAYIAPPRPVLLFLKKRVPTMETSKTKSILRAPPFSLSCEDPDTTLSLKTLSVMVIVERNCISHKHSKIKRRAIVQIMLMLLYTATE